jgi:hypothetical protein
MSRKYRSGAGSSAREEMHSRRTRSNNKSYDASRRQHSSERDARTVYHICTYRGSRLDRLPHTMYIRRYHIGQISEDVAPPFCVVSVHVWTLSGAGRAIPQSHQQARMHSHSHSCSPVLCYRSKGEAILVCVDPKPRRNVIACRVEPMHYVIAN